MGLLVVHRIDDLEKFVEYDCDLPMVVHRTDDLEIRQAKKRQKNKFDFPLICLFIIKFYIHKGNKNEKSSFT